MTEKKKLLLMAAVFLGCFYLPVEMLPFRNPVFESLALVRWYAREHVLLCLIPAFFIAGAISVFISQASVIKYFGAQANKVLAYSVAAVSGTILAVCSCTVLPLFSGIYKRGAGLGPATAFLYSGPAINVLAIIMTARILGWQLGLARAVGAVVFSVVIGLLMHLIFIKEERARRAEGELFAGDVKEARSLGQNGLYFAVMVGFLVFVNWARPQAGDTGMWALIFGIKWFVSFGFLAAVGVMLAKWFRKDELKEWAFASWTFAKQIMPLLLIGVLVAGLLLGRPGEEGLIPSWIIEKAVGGNSFRANFYASFVGALMYFATLTEVPILEGLIGAGMGKGPALALLLAGPALSLPNMLVIRGVIGTKKTLVYVSLVVVMATVSGMIFGKMLGGPAVEQRLLLGFCPTMAEHAQAMARQNKNIDIREFPNSAQAMALLREGHIDGALIGRKAWKSELAPDIQEQRVAAGWTLISSHPRQIAYRDLNREVVHTYLDPQMVERFLPEGIGAIYYATKEEAFAQGMHEVVLADWDDLPARYGLVMPVEGQNKVPRFRAPFLYARDLEIF